VSESKVEELGGTVKSLREAEEASSMSQVIPLIDLDSSLNIPEGTSRDFNSPIPTDTKEVGIRKWVMSLLCYKS